MGHWPDSGEIEKVLLWAGLQLGQRAGLTLRPVIMDMVPDHRPGQQHAARVKLWKERCPLMKRRLQH